MQEHDWLQDDVSRSSQPRLAGALARRVASPATRASETSIERRNNDGDPIGQYEQASRLARFLETLGVAAGDTVAVLLRDPSRLPLVIDAAIQARGKLVVLPAGMSGETIAACIEKAEPRLVITESCYTAVLVDCAAAIIDLDTDADYWADLVSSQATGDVASREVEIVAFETSGQPVTLAESALLTGIAQLQKQCPLSAETVVRLDASVGAVETVSIALWCLLTGASLRGAQPMVSQSACDDEMVAAAIADRSVQLRRSRRDASVYLSVASASGTSNAEGATRRQRVLRDTPVLLAADVSATGPATTTSLELPQRLGEAFVRFADREGYPVADLLFAAWTALLHRYADEPRLTLASMPAAAEAAVSPPRLVTTSFADDVTYRNLLAQLAACDDADAGDWIESELVQAAQGDFNRLSQFALRICPAGAAARAERDDLDQRCLDRFKLDLVCRFELAETHIRYVLTGRESFARHGLITRLAESFETLAGQCIEQPDADLGSLPVLSERQYHTQVQVWNDTDAPFDDAACIHQLFERQAAVSPDAQAIYDDRSAYSYRDLNERANRLARFIQQISAAAAESVCVMLDRRVDVPVALLAILKCGKAYIPLDAQHPPLRNAGIIGEQSVRILITHACYRTQVDALLDADCGLRHIIYLDTPPASLPSAAINGGAVAHGPDAWANGPCTNLSVDVRPSDLAYTIFTSGSTGKPKGVKVRHRPVINLIEWVNRTFSVGSDDTLLFVTSLCFDLSVYDIFGMLAAGGRIRVAPQAAIRDARALLDLLLSEPITFWDSAPANLQRLVPLLSERHAAARRHNLRLVFLSGDWIPVKLPDAMRAAFPRARIVSLGGATEATVWSNYYPIGEVGADWGSIPYGKPIQNARYYILNKRLQPCPVGVAGDLYIGGLCLADGYTSDELTQRSFIHDPFVTDSQARMYRTGDLARFEADGTMIFLGRADTQVKVRGFRVELGEIETVLQTHEDVDHCAVLLQDRHTPDPRIVAYVASRNRALDHARIRAYLEKRLPEPMLPNFSCVMPTLPINTNGKVDRAALPWPLPAGVGDSTAAEPPSISPATRRPSGSEDPREQIIGIVNELLQHGTVDTRTSLFEAGATSLTVVFLADRIKKQFGVEVSIDAFLAEPTIDALLRLLTAQGVGVTQTPAESASLDKNVGAAPSASEQAHDELAQPTRDSVATKAAGEAEIALIGIHFNFPGANDLDSFWRRLTSGEPFYGPLPQRRRALWNTNAPGTREAMFLGAYVEDIDCFDHSFFNLSAPEARSMDPQERRLMESAWLCLEDAGYCVDDTRLGRVGVFCGIMREDYASVGVEQWRATGITAFASNASGVANRISHSLGLTGPSLTVNTACASAMTALHLACNALRRGECEMALVGGVNLLSHPYHQAMLHNLRFASARGLVEPFAASADGWVPGEGVATLLLKLAADAIDDRDHIYACILGSTIGHMGSTVQYAAPNSAAQSEGMRTLLADIGLEPADIDLVECCAAGAAMGDAAEYRALHSIIADAEGERSTPCYLGTSKDYLGHLESASAMAQVIKALLQLRHEQLIPLRSRAPLSPFVVPESARMRFITAACAWPARVDGRPRTVLVNSNGAGGATGHLILAEHAADRRLPASASRELIVLSSMSEAQLRQQAAALATFLGEHSPALADVAFTLAAGRRHCDYRLAFVVDSIADLAQRLRAFVDSPRQVPGERAVSRLFELAGGCFGVVAPSARAPATEEATRIEPTLSALAALARRWAGGEATLAGLIAELEARGACRVSLPGYCFAKHRHWLGAERTAEVPASNPAVRSDADARAVEQTAPTDPAQARSNLQRFLIELVASATETPIDSVHPKENTQRYGLNSLSVASMTQALGQALGEALEPTLFFEHKTLAELADALFAARHAAVLARFGEQDAGIAMSIPAPDDVVIAPPGRVVAAATVPGRENVACGEPAIAVVGVAGRYPGADDLIDFWENLKTGRDCIREIPAERWCVDDYLPDGVPQPPQGASRCGGFIDDVDKFDPLFFGIAPATADIMDPQVRLFLQTAWEALEDAGHSSSCLKRLYEGEVGVFVGVMHGEYQLHDARTPDGAYHIGGTSYGSIAHQVSYSLDLSGPSMAIDTMCSASLTALHLATASIRRGECRAAIVGGVNLSIHPNKYIQQSLMTMHASSGRCRSFAADGDGFIPAEGVGAILIKPLDDAVRHRDQIYGLIRGSHINAGGKTYGYTVPSPTAQAALIETALRQAGVDPLQVSYIEAHGTGTSLGDPIEIKGLTRAFHQATPDAQALRARGQFCAIGSVKSNIGHCESAAGIAGLTKVLLQLKHRLLVPSIHADELNPTIDFAASPFRVQRELAQWDAPQCAEAGTDRRLPRIAGISSFGAGGANAHVLIEEFIAADTPQPAAAPGPVLIVLSARSRAQLERYAGRLKRSIAFHGYTDADLPSIGYTLAVGRDAHAHRLALIVDTVQALIQQLDAFVGGALEDRYHHAASRRGEPVSADAAASLTTERLLESFRQGALQPLADGWLRGQAVEWWALYAPFEARLRKCSLATYPFLRRSYWIGGRFEPRRKHSAPPPRQRLHPLLHDNVSDFERFAFSSSFTLEDFVLRDHVLGGRHILPGVAHLEMARAAAGLLGGTGAAGAVVCLRGIVWLQPVLLEGASVDVRLEMQRDAGDRLRFRLVSAQQGGSERVYSQGQIEASPLAEAPAIDLAQLRAQCGEQRIAAEAFYRDARAGGAAYGPAFQALDRIAAAQDADRPFVLAELRLPESLASAAGSYALHPSLMDAALQAAAAFSGIARSAKEGRAGPVAMSLPFALEAVHVYSACPTHGVVWVRPSEAGSASSASISRLDIDVADAAGRVAVAIRGYTVRAAAAEAASPSASKASALTVLAPVWEAVPQPMPALSHSEASLPGRVLCWVGADEAPRLALASGELRSVVSEASSPSTRFCDVVTKIVAIVREVVAAGAGKRLLCVVVRTEAADSALMCGLAGLLASIAREHPSIDTRLLGFSAMPSDDVLEALIAQEARLEAREVFYDQGTRHVRRLVPLASWEAAAYRWPDGGVFLITGGLGGVGRALTRHLAGLGRPMTIVLSGRKPLDRQAQDFIDATRTASAKIVYESLDVADEAAVVAALANLRRHYGAFTGIFHCAGVTRDSFIANKTAQEIGEVLAAKVAGAINLDLATRQDPLAFFVVFSSLSSLFGNPGQADYAAANGYLDGFMHERARRVRAGQAQGHSASVNWPFWAHGGMQLGAAARAELARQRMVPMANEDAMAVLEHLALIQSGQWAVFTHETAAQPTRESAVVAARVPAVAATGRGEDDQEALAELQRRLLREVSAQLKIDEAELDPDSDFSEYGFDSISLTEFANRINQATGLALLPTIFFEHQSITALSKHLLTTFGNVYGEPAVSAPPVAPAGIAAATTDAPTQAASTTGTGALADALHAHVLSEVSALLKIDVQDLDLDEELGEYGFDSINLTELSNRLQAFFDVPIMPTVFFEHPSLRRFCDYLAATHGDAVSAALAPVTSAAPIVAADVLPVLAPSDASLSPAPSEPSRVDAAVELASRRTDREPIAIIGMSGAFPRAKDIDAFWLNLLEGVDCIAEIPADRWDWREVYGDPLVEPNKTNIKWGGFIDGVGDFDPAFFGISPREALYMDPQQRLLMLHAWHAIEDAGHAPESLAGSDTAIFVGTTVSGYINLIAQSGHAIQSYSATGVSPSVGPNRISFLLDLHGPSEPIETACSSSLVAVHRAVTTLRARQCGLAIAGGVNTIVTPEVHISFNKAGMLSEDGRCKTFSRDANGYSRGEGVGMLVLKRLSDAERDRDHIYGVILASVENHGGRANSLTAPNPASQAMLLKAAYREAGIDPRTVTYIECHGTGTELGDPVEINGLKSAFRELYEEADAHYGPCPAPWCGLASVKSNVGHLEYAAGVAGVIKVLLQMRHRTLVPSLHSLPRNPYIELDGSPFEILTQTRPWERLHAEDGQPLPRRAGVSSYGFGGVNAHVVIEEYLAPRRTAGAVGKAEPVAIVLSARSSEQLLRQAARLRDAIVQRGYGDADLADIAYTLQVGRNAMRHRFAACVSDIATLSELLAAFIEGAAPAGRWMTGDAKADKAELTALLRDAEFQTLVSSWAAQRKYPQLLKLWVAGHAIDWASIANALPVPPSRLSLPGYPFDLKRYWIEPVATDAEAAKGTETTAPVRPAPQPAIEATAVPMTQSPQPREGKPVIRLVDTESLDPLRREAPLERATQRERPAHPARPTVVLSDTSEAGPPAVGRHVEPRREREQAESAPIGATAPARGVASASVLERLRGLLAEALFMDRDAIDIELPFNELGLDSVTGVEWVQSVNKAFGLKIAAAEVFNFPTLVQFAAFVSQRLHAADVAAPEAPVATDAIAPAPSATTSTPHSTAEAMAAAPAVPQVSLEEVMRFLKAQLVQVLYLESDVQDLDLPFSELGLDSVTGVEWVQAINARYSIKLPTSELFNYPTLRQLGQHVCSMIEQGAASAPAASGVEAEVRASMTDNPPAMPRLADAALPAPALAAQERRFDPVAGNAACVAANVAAASSGQAERATDRSLDSEDQVAVIGMACRFADASSPDELWRNLAAAKDSVRRADRWPGCEAINGQPLFGSFLSDIDRFDPMFFKISASEAKYMDPQQRVFLEECWKAIEDAGYAGSIEGTNCGVYVGCGSGDYGSLIRSGPPQAFWGNAMSVIASRISYYLDLQGPAVAIDTACSSSLVAIHLACRAIADGEVDLALAGGVTVLSTPSMLGSAAGAGMLSPSGRCHSFDSRADGFVAGEGAGVLLLKRLSAARRDNDNIHGVIRGSGINQDGLTNGITAPSAKSQARLETAVYSRFDIDPASITLVEAHGTGTILGDPIEFQALCEAFGQRTQRKQFCALGSIKSNIGHTIAAAGVAGVIKALLALKHRQLPPSLHFREGNPAIDFRQSPFYVNTRLRDWRVASGEIRRAAVSSFGFSGTNAHVVIDEAPVRDPEAATLDPRLVVVSAHSAKQVVQLVDALIDRLGSTEASLASIAYTLAVGRRQLPYRLAVVASSVADLLRALVAWRDRTPMSCVHSNCDDTAVLGIAEAALPPLTLQALEQETGFRLADPASADRLLERAAAYFVRGRRIDFGGFFASQPRRVSLPVYPFADERYWVDPPLGALPVSDVPVRAAAGATRRALESPALVDEDGLLESLYEGELSIDDVLKTLP